MCVCVCVCVCVCACVYVCTLTNVRLPMSCRRHSTSQPTPSQYTDTGPTSGCAIH